MNFLKIAWRNSMRNKRRTIITSASVFFAVFLALFMRSMQLGSYDNMITNIVGALTGNIQIHKAGYWDDKIIDNSFEYTSDIESVIKNTDHIVAATPRVELFALASHKKKTKGVMIIGVNPDAENAFSKLKDKLVDGEYLKANTNGIIISEGLASYLKITVSDSIILLGQGFHGMSAAGIFPVIGIVKFPSPDLNKRLVYLNLESMQYFSSLDKKITSLSIKIDSDKNQAKVISHLENQLSTKELEIMGWQEISPELSQSIEADNGSGIIMLAILYLIVAFGIFGTLIMMINERIREFGVMLALGMQKAKIATLVFFEIMIIGALGLLSGVALSAPAILYFYKFPIRYTGDMAAVMESYGMEPILQFAFEPGFYINQTLTVFVIILLLVIIPISKIFRLNTIKALRS